MKKLYKYLSVSALSGLLCVSLTFTANAQHRGGGGGGGGGNSSPAPQRSAPAPQPAPQRSAPAPSQSRPAPQSYSRPSAPRTTGTVRSYNNQQHYVQRNGVTQRAYSGHIGTRPATTGVNAQRGYRTYQGSVYGHNHPGYSGVGVNARRGYLPGRASYHYNHGYYGSYYGPRLGFSVGFLPYGYYPFYFDDYQYFYSGGLFYQYNNDQYTVVEPPVGAEVTTLPSNAQSIVINGQQYYEVNGVYYQPITKDDGTLSYQVAGKDGELNTDGDEQGVDNAPAGPQIGDVVSQLPPNCRKININGEKLYLSEDGVYYKVQLDQDNNKVYKIVGLPSDDDQNQGQQDQGGN